MKNKSFRRKVESNSKILTRSTYIIGRPNIVKKNVAATTRKLGTLKTDKLRLKRLDFCFSTDVVMRSFLLLSSVADVEPYRKPNKLFTTRAPARIRIEFLQPTTITNAATTWLRTIVPKPWPAEAIPRAMDRHFSKDLLTISKHDKNVNAPPTPRHTYDAYKVIKWVAKDVMVRLTAQIRHPMMDITRQPKRFIREPAKGPSPWNMAMETEPHQA